MAQSGYSARRFVNIGDALTFLQSNEIVCLDLQSDRAGYILLYRPLEVITRITDIAVSDAAVQVMVAEYIGRFSNLRLTIHNTDTAAGSFAIDEVIVECAYDDNALVVPTAEWIRVAGTGDNIAADIAKSYEIPDGFAFMRVFLGGAGGATTATLVTTSPSPLGMSGIGAVSSTSTSPVPSPDNPIPGTVVPVVAGAGASATTAIATLTGRSIRLEVGGEVYVKFGGAAVTTSAADYHTHLVRGESRNFFLAAGHTHVAMWGIGAAHPCCLWRVDGV